MEKSENVKSEVKETEENHGLIPLLRRPRNDSDETHGWSGLDPWCY